MSVLDILALTLKAVSFVLCPTLHKLSLNYMKCCTCTVNSSPPNLQGLFCGKYDHEREIHLEG